MKLVNPFRIYRRPSSNLVVSFPKSGRTWLRVMLDDLGVPLKYTHAGAGHRGARPIDELTPPGDLLGRGKVVFMHRSPRDTVVSGYYQATKRIENFTGTMSEFLRHPNHGVAKIVAFNRMWLAAVEERDDAIAVSYEGLLADTLRELRRILAFLDVDRSEEELIAIIKGASFEAMKSKEASGAYSKRYGAHLRPSDINDPDSFKVRRGKVGGWKDEFSPDDIAYCETIGA